VSRGRWAVLCFICDSSGRQVLCYADDGDQAATELSRHQRLTHWPHDYPNPYSGEPITLGEARPVR
jgi:hypothetical protein